MFRYSSILLLILIPVVACALSLRDSETIFLENGVRMDCEAFWKEGNNIIILIENGTTMAFPKKDVDMKKTFRKGMIPIKTVDQKNELINSRAKRYALEKSAREKDARLAEQKRIENKYRKEEAKTSRPNYSSESLGQTNGAGPINPISGTSASETQRMCAEGCAALRGTNERMSCYVSCTRGN